MRLTAAMVACSIAVLICLTNAQQFAGDIIQNSLPYVPGAEIAYWKIHDTKSSNLTLINYQNLGKDGNRQNPVNVKRAVVMIHGLNRDPGTYQSNMLSALSQVPSSEINTDSVAIVAPYFPNGDDKATGYPWVNGLKATQGSITNCLVWSGSQWSAGANNQYPWTSSKNISSYTVLDQMISYFDNKTMYPNLNQIVIAGHSLGGQTVQRYAAIGQPGNTRTLVSYWVANPNSYVWLGTDRPLSTASCPIYDNYREGYTNFSQYPMTYGLSLVNSGRANILANFNSKAINYARGTEDLGDDSSSCSPFTAGANRNERFFNFIKAFPPSCSDPSSNNCDTVDFVAAGHDGGAMMASAAGQARLFTDNWSGNHSRSYDMGYPRQAAGDDPYPNPALNSSTAAINNNTYAGNMTYWGCWSDQTIRSLSNMTYQGDANTIEFCTAACAFGGNTIAGLEAGNQCFCGSSLSYMAQEVIDSSCGTACSGNSSEICGGGNRMSLFSNGAPTVNAAPGTPEVVDSDWYYINCYTEATGGARAIGGKGTSGSFMTLEYCASFCEGYQYFGTEYADECYCGNSFASGASVASSGDCSMTCASDNTELCGAGNRLTVYQNTSWVAPSGTSSSSAAGSSPTSAGPSCPGSNAMTVTSNGKSFVVECGIDHSGGDLTSLSVSDFQGCIDACALNSQCVDVSLSGSACYLKSSLRAAVSNEGVWGARLVTATTASTSSSSITASGSTSTASASSVSSSSVGSLATGSPSASTASSSAIASATAVADCPSSNSTTVISNGKSFIIECGIDHAGGDLTSPSVSSFQGCINACANNAACVDVSLSGSACYLKSSVGAPVNNGVWGARLLSSSTASSTSSQATTLSTSTGSGSSTPSSSTPVGPTTSSSSAIVSSSSAGTPSTSSTGSSTSNVPTTSSVASTSSQTVSSSSSASASAMPSAVVCPGSNSTTYVSNGLSFLIECGIDHQAGDLSSLSVSSFAQCIDTCATTTSCVDVVLSGSACYLKSSVGRAISNGVWGALLQTTTSSSSQALPTSSSSSSASPTTASSSSGTVAASTSSNSIATTTSSPTSNTQSTSNSSSSLPSPTSTTSIVAVLTTSGSSASISTSTESSSAHSGPPTSSSAATSTSTSSTAPSTTSSSSSSAPPTTSSTTFSSTTLSTSTGTLTSSSASASATKLACPASNNTVYTAPQGHRFLIECGIDHSGGDMSMSYVSNFTQCVNTCESTTGCVDVSLSGTACYLKKTLGDATSNAGILGAKLVSSTSTSSVAAATSPAAS